MGLLGFNLAIHFLMNFKAKAGGLIPFGFIKKNNSSLYTFTTFTFTSAGTSGRNGPSLATLLSSYGTATYPWLSNTTYFNSIGGIQFWTVPKNGIYQIQVYGACGALTNATVGGLGAIMKGTFTLTQGQVLKILVGQTGNANTGWACGGGGGTFVTTNSNSPLIIAGGGAGAASTGVYLGANGDLGTSGKNSAGNGTSSGGSIDNGVGGTSGAGGTCGNYCASGAGGGLTGNGANGSAFPGASLGGGLSFINGGTGGQGADGGDGGFGGGGGSASSGGYSSAGGGGYSGGAGGCWTNTLYRGGGGGSYNGGTSQTNTTGANAGSGYVVISLV
jgi:hypothetical protein